VIVASSAIIVAGDTVAAQRSTSAGTKSTCRAAAGVKFMPAAVEKRLIASS